MTGMESFNAASKRGALPMNSTAASGMPSTIATSGDSQSQGKSNMRKSFSSDRLAFACVEAMLNNKNKQPGKNVSTSQGKGGHGINSGIDNKEKKIYEIYASSGKVMAPIGSNNFGGQHQQ